MGGAFFDSVVRGTPGPLPLIQDALVFFLSENERRGSGSKKLKSGVEGEQVTRRPGVEITTRWESGMVSCAKRRASFVPTQAGTCIQGGEERTCNDRCAGI